MTDAPKPWHDAFPSPQTTAPLVTREEALQLQSLNSDDLLLVDVRRTDFEGGTIKGSLNLPAHSFYMNRAVLFNLCKRAGVKKVAFYCGEYYCIFKPGTFTSFMLCCVSGVYQHTITSPQCHRASAQLTVQWLRHDRFVKWQRSALLGLVCRLHR